MADYLFILNPTSGTTIGAHTNEVLNTIKTYADLNQCKAHILFTKARGHAPELVTENLKLNHWKAIVAVGGDGTVNEIAKPLINQSVPLGIVPLGSGNGLARHLGIPLTLTDSLKRLFEGRTITIDSAQLNNIPFFCTAGMGFDAYVGHLFSQQQQRGLSTYVRVSYQAYWNYRPLMLQLNGKEVTAFSLTFANAGQFGNNAWIAPQADIQDGLLDICTIKTFPRWFGTSLVYQLFTKQMKSSEYIEYQNAMEAVVETEKPPMIHYDGEPLQLDTNQIRIKLNPKSLNVIV